MKDSYPERQRPNVSVVIVTHDRRDHLFRCLESVFEQDFKPLEVVVLFNPLDSEVKREIEERYRVRTLHTHRNLGAFPAKNVAIASTSGEYVMVMDDDAYFMDAAALGKMVSCLRSHPEAALVTANVYGPLEGIPRTQTEPVPLYKDGFSLYRREVFEEWVGYAPDLFFRAAGESYYANRLFDMGKVVMAVHDARMFHAQTGTGRSTFEMNYYGVRSHLLLALIQDPLVVLPFSLPKRIWSSLLNIGARRRAPRAFAQGILGAFWVLPEALRLRNPIRLSTYRMLRRWRAQHMNSSAVIMTSSEL